MHFGGRGGIGLDVFRYINIVLYIYFIIFRAEGYSE